MVPSYSLFLGLRPHLPDIRIILAMGFTDNNLVAKLINGGQPPRSGLQDQPPPTYQAGASPQLIQNDALQKTRVDLNMPTQKEREELAQLERERKKKGCDER